MKNRLYELRVERNLSIVKLSLVSSVSTGEIWNIENDEIKDVGLTTAWKLAKALNVGVFDIFQME